MLDSFISTTVISKTKTTFSLVYITCCRIIYASLYKYIG